MHDCEWSFGAFVRSDDVELGTHVFVRCGGISSAGHIGFLSSQSGELQINSSVLVHVVAFQQRILSCFLNVFPLFFVGLCPCVAVQGFCDEDKRRMQTRALPPCSADPLVRQRGQILKPAGRNPRSGNTVHVQGNHF